MVEAVDNALLYSSDCVEGLQQLRSWLRSITSVEGKTLEFLQRAMQLAGPLMAKGIEDTTYYQDVTLLAANEVGVSPSPVAILTVEEFHDRMLERRLSDINATETHDTKRGEDGRARLLALPYIMPEWASYVEEGFAVLAKAGKTVDKTAVYSLLQSIYASARTIEDLQDSSYVKRVKAYIAKALRESKTLSNWSEPDVEMEGLVAQATEELLASSSLKLKLKDLLNASMQASWHMTSVLQILKATVPGSPDYYQGSAYLDYSMVDPDNRRPIDYSQRERTLSQSADSPNSGESENLNTRKQMLAAKLLAARNSSPEVWGKGEYVPVRVDGPAHNSCLCFRRVFGDSSALVILRIRPDTEMIAGSVKLPAMGLQQDALTGQQLSIEGNHTVQALLANRIGAVYVPSL